MLIKRILSILVFLLLANAAVRVGLVFFHDQQFKDAVRELALFAGQPPGKTDEVLRGKVMELAQENQVPLDPDYVEIVRKPSPGIGEKVTIKFSYAVMVAVAPGFPRRFDFDYTTP
jgi:hypothetical protein